MELSRAVRTALDAERRTTGESLSDVIERLVSRAMGLERHTLFQVSTSSALAEGVFSGVVTVSDLLHHGDFGIGTYDRLDGELVILDGQCFRVGGEGHVVAAEPDWTVPFAVMTRFESDTSTMVESVSSVLDLQVEIDRVRPSANVFVAMRVSGRFDQMFLRAVCRARPGEDLVHATSRQSEFRVGPVTGTLVGFWSPEHGRSIDIPGYHFHFIADDHRTGGHVLDLVGGGLRVDVATERDVHVALPTTREFLEADLRTDPVTALEVAESAVDRRRVDG